MNDLSDFDLLTLSEVAQLLHCSKAHVCHAIAGQLPGCPPIPAVCLGRRKLVRRATLLSWIERNEGMAGNDNRQAAANDNLNHRQHEAAKAHRR